MEFLPPSNIEDVVYYLYKKYNQLTMEKKSKFIRNLSQDGFDTKILQKMHAEIILQLLVIEKYYSFYSSLKEKALTKEFGLHSKEISKKIKFLKNKNEINEKGRNLYMILSNNDNVFLELYDLNQNEIIKKYGKKWGKKIISFLQFSKGKKLFDLIMSKNISDISFLKEMEKEKMIDLYGEFYGEKIFTAARGKRRFKKHENYTYKAL